MRLFRRVLEALEIKDAVSLLPQSAQPGLMNGQLQPQSMGLGLESPDELILEEEGVTAQGGLL